MRSAEVIGLRGGPVSAVAALAFALAALGLAVPARAAVACPDAATVSAARLIEFQAMMMNVSVRCNHVGVAMSDHIDKLSAGHTTMFQEAHSRVRAYLLAARAGLSAPVAKGKEAPTSRRTDPLDRYITMAGNRYGGGSTTPDRCHAFEAIALSLSEPGNTDKLLSMVADSLIAQTMLESITNCTAKP